MDDTARARLYEAYSSTHAGRADETAVALTFRRDIRPHLPVAKDAAIVDIGCGQGQLIKQLLLAGYENSRGVDISPEQVKLALEAGITAVQHGDFREYLADQPPVDAVTATDFFEHLTKEEVLDALDEIAACLTTEGVLIMRVPNMVSPFGGNYRYGDLTHETSFTARSLRQLGAAVGLGDVKVHACPPPVHGTKSMARAAVWKVASGSFKVALAAETGQLRGHLVTQNIVASMRRVQ